MSESGFTPVFLASLIGDREAVEGLLRAGAHPDGDPRFAPVHAAALRGTSILRRLLAAGANPDGREGARPALLHAAVLNNRPRRRGAARGGGAGGRDERRGGHRRHTGRGGGALGVGGGPAGAGGKPLGRHEREGTLAGLAYRSRLGTATEEGAARPRDDARLVGEGWPWTPPDAPTVRGMVERGMWPPRR